MAEISDGRLTLLVFGVHGVAERAVDHRSEVLRVERIQPEGRAEDEIILAFIGDDKTDVFPGAHDPAQRPACLPVPGGRCVPYFPSIAKLP